MTGMGDSPDPGGGAAFLITPRKPHASSGCHSGLRGTSDYRHFLASCYRSLNPTENPNPTENTVRIPLGHYFSSLVELCHGRVNLSRGLVLVGQARVATASGLAALGMATQPGARVPLLVDVLVAAEVTAWSTTKLAMGRRRLG